MKSNLKHIMLGVMLIMFPMLAIAQVDGFGKTDTLYAELARIDSSNWTITFSYTNDEWIEALSLPFIIDAGDTKIVGDSAVYTGGRVADFDYKGYRADSSIQCFTLGMMANFGPSQNGLPPGSGRLATVFVSSLDGSPIEKLTMDSTTTPPTNTLMTIAQAIQPGESQDSVRVYNIDEQTIIPVLVIKTIE